MIGDYVSAGPAGPRMNINSRGQRKRFAGDMNVGNRGYHSKRLRNMGDMFGISKAHPRFLQHQAASETLSDLHHKCSQQQSLREEGFLTVTTTSATVFLVVRPSSLLSK